MKLINGILVKPQDLKKEENGKLTLFIQLEDLAKKNNEKLNGLQGNIFDRYDTLVFTPQDEIKGVKKEKAVMIDKITGSFRTVQQMFAS